VERKTGGVEDHSLPNRFPLMRCPPTLRPTIEGLRPLQNMIRLMPPASLCRCPVSFLQVPSQRPAISAARYSKYYNQHSTDRSSSEDSAGYKGNGWWRETPMLHGIPSAFEPLRCGLKLRSPHCTPRFLPPRFKHRLLEAHGSVQGLQLRFFC
jgi:hypothetical protein